MMRQHKTAFHAGRWWPQAGSRGVFARLSAVVLGVSVAACSGGTGSTGQTASNIAGKGNCSSYYPLTVSEVEDYFGANTFTAQAAGFFHKNCLNVTVDGVASGPAMTALVLGGHAQIGDSISSGLFPNIRKGQDTNVEWLMTSERWDFNLIAAPGVPLPHQKDPWPAPMKDTVGKAIGVTAPGSTTYFEALAWLKQAGINPSSVTIVGLGTPAEEIGALKSGKVQFLVDDPPIEQLLGPGGFQMVVHANDQASNGPNLPTVFANVAYITTKQFSRAHPSVVNNFCKAIWQTWQFESNKNNLDRIAQIYERTFKLNRDQAVSMWKGNYSTLNPRLTPAEFANFRLASPAGEQGYAPPYGKYVDKSCATGSGL